MHNYRNVDENRPTSILIQTRTYLSKIHDLHVALFNVLDSLVDVIRHFLPNRDAEVALELGAPSHLSCQHGSECGDFIFDLG